MTGKWERLCLDARKSVDHGCEACGFDPCADQCSECPTWTLRETLDRLEREEAEAPRERCEECARAYGALMRAGVLPTDDAARMDSVIAVLARQRDDVREVPVPIPSADARVLWTGVVGREVYHVICGDGTKLAIQREPWAEPAMVEIRVSDDCTHVPDTPGPMPHYPFGPAWKDAKATPPVPIPSAEACDAAARAIMKTMHRFRACATPASPLTTCEEEQIRGMGEVHNYLRSLHGGGSKPRPRIVCLCGSTRFKDAFLDAGRERPLHGEIVLSVGFFMHSGDHCTPEQKEAADELHLRKIDLCDYVLVLNVGGYIGESTRREIAYAEKIGKPVEYLEPLHGGGKEDSNG